QRIEEPIRTKESRPPAADATRRRDAARDQSAGSSANPVWNRGGIGIHGNFTDGRERALAPAVPVRRRRGSGSPPFRSRRALGKRRRTAAGTDACTCWNEQWRTAEP